MRLLNPYLFLSFCLVAGSFGTSSAVAANTERGKQLFAERCVTCHGAQGAGDGPVALSLPPEMKPRNLQTEANKFAIDDAKFKELLKKGGSGVGLNPLMPPQADLSDADIDSVIAFVHTLKKK